MADALDENALARLLEAKKRDANKGFIVLIPDLAALKHICALPLPPMVEIATQLHWQSSSERSEDPAKLAAQRERSRATTLILPAKPGLSKLLTGGRETLAVRLPQSPYMQAYMQAWKETSIHGILVSTSLNESGQPAATHASQIPAGIPALALDAELSGTPSRIFNPLDNTWLR